MLCATQAAISNTTGRRGPPPTSTLVQGGVVEAPKGVGTEGFLLAGFRSYSGWPAACTPRGPLLRGHFPLGHLPAGAPGGGDWGWGRGLQLHVAVHAHRDLPYPWSPRGVDVCACATAPHHPPTSRPFQNNPLSRKW